MPVQCGIGAFCYVAMSRFAGFPRMRDGTGKRVTVQTYIIRRLLNMIPLLFGISFISFGIMYLAPGDFLGPLRLSPEVTPETIARMATQYGLDQPFIVQYWSWFKYAFPTPWSWGIDLGRSFQYHVPVTHLIGTYAFNTILLSVGAAFVAWLFAIPIGIYAARHQYSFGDKALTTFSFLGVSIPNFFLALVLLYLVVKFKVPLPVGGATTIGYDDFTFWGKAWDRTRHLLVPVVVLGTGSMASLMRFMRSNLLDALRQDYVRTARAKGLRERFVVYKHALRNAINPLITLFGFELGGLLSGAAITEQVTSYPGLGRLFLGGIRANDYYLVLGILMVASMMLVVGNLIADVLLAWSDPRIRYQ